MEQVIKELHAKQTITELSARYMRGLDRADANTLRAVFFDDAYCEYGFLNGSADEFVNFAVTELKKHQANQHLLGNILIELEGDEAFGEVYFHAYHKINIEGVFYDMIVAGRYLDRYECRQGVWKMAYRSERVDWSRTTETCDPYFEQVPATLLAGKLDDAVYDREARRKKFER
ncbi:nuclear transport factor 2 family protein [Oceanicoccus sp. KOV_DT_Chl]|uniref:nuclear transport factor 2 family protein n=1 Tax=Oceanicoccus sp. KOV_DT_Chl TaxID=1904639 RepID=UPI000C7C59B2|nr:nuclear transport factor 2 family protein [Oceanicoccus sp. KOV_DT_Chl]